MAGLIEQIKRIKKLGSQLPKVQDPILGLVEEVGEVTQALNVKYHGKKKELTESPAEECVDVITSTLELFFDEGGTLELLEKHMRFKLDRWERRLEKRNK